MRTPQTQIENASPSTVTSDDGRFFSGSKTEISETLNEKVSPDLQTDTERENVETFQKDTNLTDATSPETANKLENQESPQLTSAGNDNFINDLEDSLTNLTEEELTSADQSEVETPRRVQQVPNSLEELRALQNSPQPEEETADLNTDRLSGITASLGILTPTQLGRAAPEFNSATHAAFDNEISIVKNDLPVMEQPTGLAPGEAPITQQPLIPIERTAEVNENTDSEPVLTEIEPTPEPLPAQARTPISRPANEQELERAISGLQINTEVNADLGDPPEIDLSGRADPDQVEREQSRNLGIIENTRLDEVNSFRRDFGENDIYPSIPTRELSTSEELTAPRDIPTMGSELSFPLLLESDQALLNEDLLTEFEAERTQIIGESQIAGEEFDLNRETAIVTGLDNIRAEEQRATEEQIRVRRENAAAIIGYREDHQRESDQIITDYEDEVSTERTAHDQEFQSEFDSTMDEVEGFFDQTEGEISERERAAAQRVALRRQRAEEEESERSWFDEAVDAVTDFFNALIDEVTQIIDDLRAAVKVLIDAVKAKVVALIDAARNLLIGMIRYFGNTLIALSNRALSRFPGLRDRVNGLINDSMNWAMARVNEIAGNLKTFAIIALDAIGSAIDGLLAAYQAVIVMSLGFFRDLTIASIRTAEAFYYLLLNTILQIATLVMFVAVISAGNIFLSTAWHFLGDNTKKRLINIFLDILISIFEAAPDEFDQGFLWPIFVNMHLGFFYEIYHWEMETQLAFFNKLAGILTSPTFWWNFFLGIFVGIWDNIWGILEGIWALIRFIFYDLWVLIDRVVQILMDIAPDIVALIQQLNQDIHNFIAELKATGKEKLEQLKNNLSRENIEAFFEGLEDDIKTRAQVMGGRLAQQAKDFMLSDEAYATIGLSVGRITGYLLVEILLAVFTVGIGTAIKWGLKGVKVAVRIARMLGSVGRTGGLFSRIIRFFSKGVKWLIRAIVKFAEKVAKVAKNLLERFKTIFSNLSRRIDDIVDELTGRRTRRDNANNPNRSGGDQDRDHDGDPHRRRRRDDEADNRNNSSGWQVFKASVHSAFSRYHDDGITHDQAIRTIRNQIRRHRAAAIPRSGDLIDRDKGYYEIFARKRGGTISRQVERVPVIRTVRWELAKTAIRRRLSRILENQINRTGITSILTPFKDDYKFSRLYVEWDESESDWNIMGAMSSLVEIYEVIDHNARFNKYKRTVINEIITANFPGKQEGYAKKQLEQIARDKTIFDSEAKEAIKKVQVITVDNGTRLNIKATMKKVSPLLRWVHKVRRLPDGRSRSPITMDWYNAEYAQVYLRVRTPNNTRFWDLNNNPPPHQSFTVNPTMGATLVVPKSQSSYSGTSKDVRGKKRTRIGISPFNKVIPGVRLKRTRSSTVRGPAARSFRTLLHHYGYNWQARGHQADHVKDLGFGGDDDFKNLWPLGARQNLGTAREIYNQRVYYQENGERISSTPGQGRNINLWFKVKGVRRIT